MVKKYLLRVKLPFVEGILENALVRVNVIRWEGFDIIPDPSAGSGTTNNDDSKHAMFFIAPGDNSPVVFAARTPQPRTYQSETYRGTRITDEISYGADVIYPERGRIAKHSHYLGRAVCTITGIVPGGRASEGSARRWLSIVWIARQLVSRSRCHCRRSRCQGARRR